MGLELTLEGTTLSYKTAMEKEDEGEHEYTAISSLQGCTHSDPIAK